ncbi:MAG: DUF3127 domain-containing protein [Alphaproteobacteria bacterium]|nr:DUF3127 domain-containing protein [Alphaproteobacteria bacterium]
MSNYQIQGRVIHVGETEEIGEKKFRKRVVVVETGADTDWPQQVPVEFVQANVDRLDAVTVGSMIEIEFDIRGREWKGKYYVNLAGWKVRLLAVEQRAPAAEPPAPHGYVDFGKADDADDGIPF